MRYLGGKSRIAKQLSGVIDSIRHPGQLVWDAFCGGLSMSVALRKKGPVWSTDACVPLISLYQAVQAGWSVKTEVPREAYAAAKSLPDSDPMKAFCGFGCSFSGKWFGGYAAPFPTDRTPHGAALRALKRDCAAGRFEVLDFLSVQPQPCEAILYLDPPYAGTTGYDGAPPFDAARFIQRVRDWSRWTHVFVSEYAFPIGECVWASECRTTAGGKSGHGSAVERLFYVGPTTALTSNLDGPR